MNQVHQFGIFEANSYKEGSKTWKVLKHLQEKGSITSWEAITLYRATRLSGIIFNLREDGYIIDSKNEKGDGTHWVRYIYIGKS